MRDPRPARFACLVALLSGVARADVWTVDYDGTADYTRIQDAVDAASDGDTILVRRQDAEALWLDGFVVDGKSLAVVALDEEKLSVGPITVRNLALGQTFVLSGFRVYTTPPGAYLAQYDPTAVGLVLEDDAGSVRVQDCAVSGYIAWSDPAHYGVDGTDAVAVRACDDVALARNELLGGLGYLSWSDGGDALDAQASTVSAYDTRLAGGAGGYDGYPINDGTGGDGGNGAGVRTGLLYLSRCELSGGDGGSGSGFFASYGGDGGDGLAASAGTTVYTLACTPEAGVGGYGIQGDGQPGADVTGPVTLVPGALPKLQLARAYAPESTEVEVRVVGTPGDFAQLLVSQTPQSMLAGPSFGMVHVAQPDRYDLGVVPPGGELVRAFAVPVVASGAVVLHLQVAVGPAPSSFAFSNPRVLVAIDEGELPACGGRLYVDGDAPAGGDGHSWATAFQDLQDALAAVVSCPDHPTEVWVAEGTYRPAPPGGDPERSFSLTSGAHVYGGFRGVETSLSERDPAAHPVVLSGDLLGDDLPGFVNRTDNSRHVVRTGNELYLSQSSRIDGVIVRGGRSLESTFGQGGGGILARGDGLVLAGMTIEDNETLGAGGGLLSWAGGDLAIVDCVVQGNRAGYYGGGMRLFTGDGNGELAMENCLFRGNVSDGFAGALVIGGYGGTLANTTVAHNDAEDYGGLMLHVFELSIVNCVIWGNTDDNTNVFRANLNSAYPAWTNLSYCCVEGWNGLGGPTNLASDPLFRDPLGPDGIPGTADDDLRLTGTSPCVDAGSNSAVPPDVADVDGDGDTGEVLPRDLDGRPRFVDLPAAADVGEGTAPIVDMGAYEHQGP